VTAPAASLPHLWLFTDDAYGVDHVARVVRAAREGAPLAVVVRSRDPARREAIVSALHGAGAPLFVSQDATHAASGRAAGVHLGGLGARGPEAIAAELARAREGVGPGGRVSVPCHENDDVLLIARGLADVVVVSPVLASPGKGAGRGVACVAAARAAEPGAWLVALGGIGGAVAAAECRAAGADGVGVVRALLDAPSPGSAAAALVSPWAADAHA
jgi:thiamine-phosphate pyrophosphorylase